MNTSPPTFSHGPAAPPAADAALQRAEGRVRNDLLALVLLLGAFGAPLIGPLRETVQRVTGLSRFQLGAGVFLMGLTAGAAGLAAVNALRGRWPRPRFIRIGAFLIAGGTLMLALVPPAPGIPVLLLGFAWFLILLGGAGVGLANATIIDIYRRTRPHRGVILLHAANALGKVGAPLLVLIAGTSLRRNGAIYFTLVSAVALHSMFWPRNAVRTLVQMEQDENTAVRTSLRAPAVLFWMTALQFAFIAGAEAGVTSILGSFIYVWRPPPHPAVSPSIWAATMVLLLQIGIACGRFAFFALTSKLDEFAIIKACLPFVLFALPLAFCRDYRLYAPSAFLLGPAFSATWPAFFALAVRSFPHDRSAFTMASRLSSIAGVNGCILIASAIGDRDAALPVAVVCSAAILLLFALFLTSPQGRRLHAALSSEPTRDHGT